MAPDELWWKKFARYAVSWLVSLPWLLIHTIFSLTDAKNPYLLLFLSELLPNFMLYMSLFGLGDILNQKLGILEMS